MLPGSSGFDLALECGERVMERRPAPLLLVPLEQRPVDDPAEGVGARRDLPPALGEAHAHHAEHPVRDRRLVGNDQQQVALLRAKRLVELRELRAGQELRSRRAPAVALAERPDEALGPELLRVGDQPVELGARQVPLAGVHALDDATTVERAAEDAELGLAEGVGEVGQLHPEADVGAVGAVARQRIVMGDPRGSAARPRSRQRRARGPSTARSPRSRPRPRRTTSRCRAG